MNTTPILKLRENRPFTDVISETFAFFRQNLKPLSQLYIKKVLPYFVLSVIGIVVLFGVGGVLFMDSILGISEPELPSIGFIVLGSLGLLGVIILSALGFAALVASTFEYMRLYDENDGEVVIDEVWERASSQLLWILGAYFGRSFLLSIIAIPLMVLFVYINLGFVSFILLFPIIYLWNGTSIMFASHFMEGIPFMDSMKRSLYLIRDNWWNTFGLWFLLGLIFSLFSAANQIIVSMFSNVGIMLGLDGTGFALIGVFIAVVFSVLSILISYISYALYTIAEGLWYYSLVEKKEAVSLGNRIESIGGFDE